MEDRTSAVACREPYFLLRYGGSTKKILLARQDKPARTYGVSMPYITRNHPKLTQEGANAVLAAAQQRAREIGIAMNIAIADEGGHMMVFSRMDGARISSVRIAIAKARAAAIQQRATGPADGDPSKVMMSLAIAITSLGIQTPMRGWPVARDRRSMRRRHWRQQRYGGRGPRRGSSRCRCAGCQVAPGKSENGRAVIA